MIDLPAPEQAYISVIPDIAVVQTTPGVPDAGRLDGGVARTDHVQMVMNRDSAFVPWSNRASTRTIGEGVAALLLRRGRLGSPPA